MASVVAPLVLGMAVGSVLGGHIAIEDGAVTSGLFGPWLRPFPIMCGLVAVAAAGFLAACNMAGRTTGELSEDFRRRGLAAGLVLGALIAIAVLVAWLDADWLWDSLLDAAPLSVLGIAAAALAGSLVVLWTRRHTLGYPVAAVAVALAIGAGAAAQYPYLIPPGQRISDVAAGDTMVFLFLVTFVGALVVLVPSLALLFHTFREKTDQNGL